MLESVLDPVFRPLLEINHFFALLVISLLITIITTLIYKYTTDQKVMKEAREDMKKMQAELKKNKDNPKKMADIQKRMMEKNMIFMKNSFKPMLYTFIPLIIIFGWLNANLSFEPLQPNTQFEITAEFNKGITGNASLEIVPEIEILQKNQEIPESGIVAWSVNGKEGDYIATIRLKSFAYEKDFVISEKKASQPIKLFKNEAIKSISTSNSKLKLLGNFSIFGWYPGWLALYILLSVVFSSVLRKVMKIA
ncbi:MAG: EMC3/TMCO1 family protein [Candidatus Woesearchaeota archaeon]